jgi:hypothetical protein
MTNVFETPWLLLFAALLLLSVVWVIRQSLPDKRTWPLLLIPPAVAILGGGLDYFVKTDYERIDTLLERGRRAAVNEDTMGLAQILADDYSDRLNGSKYELVSFFNSFFEKSQIDRIRRTASQVVIDAPTAEAECAFRVQLAPNNAYTQAGSLYFVKVRFKLTKQADGRWLISGADLREVNFQPMGWRDV